MDFLEKPGCKLSQEKIILLDKIGMGREKEWQMGMLLSIR